MVTFQLFSISFFVIFYFFLFKMLDFVFKLVDKADYKNYFISSFNMFLFIDSYIIVYILYITFFITFFNKSNTTISYFINSQNSRSIPIKKENLLSLE